MQATVTEDLELVLRWHDNGESTVRFAIASGSEFTVTGNVCWERGLNYQGNTRISFQTMCYGQDLDQFGFELRRLTQGGAESARFLNTGGDFEIRVTPHESMGRRVLLSELRYRHLRIIGDVSSDSELVMPVGPAEDLCRTAEAIREILRLFQVDCRSLFELPKSP